MGILIGVFTFILILISVFLILLVLMQKAKNDGGMGAALGGGAAEATFGADTGNVLTGATIKASVAFFVLSFLLYLGHIYQRSHGETGANGGLPSIEVPATTSDASPVEEPVVSAPVTPTAAEPAPTP